MQSPRIALLDASLGDTPAERNFRREVDAEIEAYKVSEGADPPPVAESDGRSYDGAIISGSQASVYDDEAWIEAVADWTRAAIRESIPVLGVCWGHQLVAAATGGTVEPIGRYEIGYRTIEVTDDDPLFDGMPADFVAFETHSDEVTALPEDAVELARNDCTIQSFRVGSAYGVQFHPEYDLQTARWIVDGKDLQPEREAAIREDLTRDRYQEASIATRVFDNFLAIVDDAST
ncbi:MAG: type 1 glutamine amidotransferase [Halobacteriota archaeon]